MDYDSVLELLELFRCRVGPLGKSGWLMASCPVASRRHRGGRDRHPSFSVSIAPGGYSWAKCHACGLVSDMRELVWSMSGMLPGDRLRRARDLALSEHATEAFLLEMEGLRRSSDPIARFHSPASANARYSRGIEFLEEPSRVIQPLIHAPYGHYETQIPLVRDLPHAGDLQPALSEDMLLGMSGIPDFVMSYLTGPRRRLTETSIKLWELGYRNRRVTIPLRDHRGRLVNISGRCLDRYDSDTDCWSPESDRKFLHSSDFKAGMFLYGEHLVDRSKPAILVEGFFDVISLRQSGFVNGLGCMSSSLSEDQARKVTSWVSSVIVFPDGDAGGRLLADRAETMLRRVAGSGYPIRVVTPQDGRDPDDCTPDELERLLG